MKLVISIAAMALAPALAAATVDVRSPQDVSCRHAETATVIRPETGTLTWDAVAMPRLQCEGEGLEPRDVTTADARVDFFPAFPLTLKNVSTDAAVMWLDVEREPLVLAERTVAPSAEVTILVARKRNRWIRISRKGAAPVTLRVPDESDATITVPPAVRGGEIFGRISPRKIEPLGMATSDGHRGRVERGYFSISGVPPGPAMLRAIYAGGVEQPSSRTVRVSEQLSVWVASELPRVGRIEVTIEPSACEEKATVAIFAAGTHVYSQPVDPRECRVAIEGIPPIAFDVRLFDSSGTLLGTVDDTALPDDVVRLTLGHNVPVVHGVVTIGGERAPSARLRFTNDRDPAIDVSANEAGAYDVRLPRPGKWSIHSFAAPQMNLRGGTSADFLPGEQEFNVDLPAGQLRIQVEADDRTVSHVQLSVTGPASVSSFVGVREPLVLRGLPAGEYVVRANFPGKGEATETVQLTNEEPSKEITLALRGEPLSIVVRDVNGTALPSARIIANGRVLSASANRSFSADDLRNGSPLRVTAPGHEPTCATVLRPVTTVTLRRQGALEARFVSRAAVRQFAILRDGTACAVQAADLMWQRTETGFVIRNLNAGGYTLMIEGKAQRFTVPGEPVDLP
jgi:hypothetical protein